MTATNKNICTIPNNTEFHDKVLHNNIRKINGRENMSGQITLQLKIE